MLEWNVYIENFNKKEIEVYNIFNHGGFWNDIVVSKNKYKEKEDFLEDVKKRLMHHYWSRCEWEIILSGWPPSTKFNNKKIDVYQQVLLNWELFSNYLWEHIDEIK